MDKILISSEFKLIPCNTTSIQQTIMLGIKQYGSKIRPHVLCGLILIHIVCKCLQKINIFLEIVRKYFHFVPELLRAFVMLILKQ